MAAPVSRFSKREVTNTSVLFQSEGVPEQGYPRTENTLESFRITDIAYRQAIRPSEPPFTRTKSYSLVKHQGGHEGSSRRQYDVNAWPYPHAYLKRETWPSATFGARSWEPWFFQRPPVDTQAMMGKLHKKLVQRRVSYNAALTALEGKETVSWLYQKGVQLVQAGLMARRGDVIGAVKHLSRPTVALSNRGIKTLTKSLRREQKRASREAYTMTAARNYAEFQWALAPFVNDAFEFASYLAHRRLNSDLTATKITIVSKEQWDHVHIDVKNRVNGTTLEDHWVAYGATRNTRWTYKVRLRPEYKHNVLSELGLMNLPAAVWAAAPLSFVVDWFLNIGEVLTSIETFQQWEVIDSTASQAMVYRYEETSWERILPSQMAGWTYQGTMSYSSRYCTRGGAPPFPTALDLQLSLPTGSGQLTGLLALARLAFK